MARKYQHLREGMTPQQRAEARALAEQMNLQMLLAEIRKLMDVTQVELAERLGVKQSSISKLENQSDMQISTLRRIVEALGGELEISAKLPAGRITVAQFRKPSNEAA